MNLECIVAEIAYGIRAQTLNRQSVNLEDDIRGIVLKNTIPAPRLIDCHHPVVADGTCIECGARLIPDHFS